MSVYPIPSLTSEQITLFWAKVGKRDFTACWLWLGRKNEHGYGTIKIKGRDYKAARVAWAISNGPIPDGMEVCHNCPDGDNPACCNPSHLWLGTHKENMADCAAKGRCAMGNLPKGVKHPKAKLTPEKAEYARQRRRDGASQSQVAKELGVDRTTISRIEHGQLWKDVR